MKQLLYCLVGLLLAGCKQAYESPVLSPVTGYLVIDGVILNGADSTGITLSRTSQLDNKTIQYEKGAKVKLEGSDNSEYLFTEKGRGIYSAVRLHLNNSIKYRLRITVTGGRQYLSDYAAIINNPPVDSISWKRENGGVQLYVNTHDPQNNTHYYQWVYDEAWEFHSAFISYLKYQTTGTPRGLMYSVVYRDSSTFSYDPNIITCWQFNAPTSLLLGSTAKLSNDIVYLPIAYIPPASWKLSALYSLHIKQYTWSKEGYEFLQKMKKNTEETGSVFDAQPSEIKGNIHCVADSNEPVIGYFNICPAQEKRLFIKSSEAPDWAYNSGCYNVALDNNSDAIEGLGLGLLPTVVETASQGGIITFWAAPPECVDCTLRGTNKKPAYWP